MIWQWAATVAENREFPDGFVPEQTRVVTFKTRSGSTYEWKEF